MCPPCFPLQTRGLTSASARNLPVCSRRPIASVEHSVQRNHVAFLFVAAIQNPRPGSLLLGNARRQAVSGVHDLQDAVTQLLAEDELCVLRHTHEHFVEFEPATDASMNHTARAQQRNEIREHGAIGEVR